MNYLRLLRAIFFIGVGLFIFSSVFEDYGKSKLGSVCISIVILGFGMREIWVSYVKRTS